MKKFLFGLAFAILTAVLGITFAPATVHAEPVTPVCSWVEYRKALPQTRVWFEVVTLYNWFGSSCPAPFTMVVNRLDAYWDSQATANCDLHGCQPRFGGALSQGYCDRVEFHRGDVFWGGWYDPNNLPIGVEPMSLSPDGWAGVYRITVDGVHIPTTANCAGGRYLRELKLIFVPIILR